MPKVLISDKMSPVAKEIFEREGIEVDVKTGLPPEELIEIIGDYDGLAVRSATKVRGPVLEAAKNLKVIGRAGAGVDNIDLPESTKRGIVVMNTPGGNTITTAEHAVSMLMSLARNIPQATGSMREGKWEKSKFAGVEVFNKTLGVVGLGNIGKVVADRAQGLKMQVLGYDPFITPEVASQLGVELVELDELFKRSDFVTVHTPVNDKTRNLICASTIEKMKDGVRIINCARGGIVNENDLLQALESGKVAGAAIDVYEKEPPDADNPLIKHPNIVTTPHLGASTDEAQVNVAVAVAEQMAVYLNKGEIRNAVNMPSLTSEMMVAVGPYLSLGEKIGSYYGQLANQIPKEVEITYSGNVADLDYRSITTAVLKGLLSPNMDIPINFVNASSIAQERGVKIVESKATGTKDFASMITMKVVTKEGEDTIGGALFGTHNQRIVRINNFYLEVVPEGEILIILNQDKPGVVGNVGHTLAEHNINISRMQLALNGAKKEALILANIDGPASGELVDALGKVPNVISVRHISL